MINIDKLNENQQEAVKHVDGPCMVLAGPGSGKTRVITYRIVNMVKNEGIPPTRILAISFTKASSIEMKNRALSICNDFRMNKVTFGTFHAVFFRILRKFDGVNLNSILDEKTKRIALKGILKSLNVENAEDDELIGQVINEISYVKNELMDKADFQSEVLTKDEFVNTYNMYENYKEEIKKIAIDGAELLLKLASETDGNFTFQYSPESFSGTEVDYAVEVCNAVLDVWKPTPDNKAIINIPTTVENAMPHVFACQLEYVNKHLKYRDSVILCLHPHNDRGCGVATAELGILAGAERIEGTLFGNGERTGNVDIVTMAMNMYSHGVDPKLDFSDMKHIRETYERLTRMQVDPRQPYAGDLVFTAFSGSHQDAIAKGMAWREENNCEKWTVPYLPIDPQDVGRKYDSDVIRINSQSGKGGVNYILKQNFGISLPEKMREEVGYAVKHVSDEEHKELSPQWVYDIFEDHYVNHTPYFCISECSFAQVDGIMAEATINCGDKSAVVDANGNGRLDAVSNAIKQYFGISYELSVYEEHALSHGSSSKAVAYVGITCNGKSYWGAGMDEDIIKASIHALTVAVNKLPQIQSDEKCLDERLVAMMNYMQTNYQTVTLEGMAQQFHLSTPYISKYIKEKSGKTFGEQVIAIRMKRAKTLLKNGNMTVENISHAVGYQNVENFSRQFKKNFQMTPVQYRNQNRVS